jgi:hypothetical protein
MVGQNYVVYLHPETKKFIFVPWDLDRAFGNFFFPNPEELSLLKAWTENNRFLNRVMSVPAVRDAYLTRLQEFQKSLFDPTRLTEKIDKIAALIRPVVAEEGEDRLGRFDRALADSAPAESAPADRVGLAGFACRARARSRPSSRHGISQSPTNSPVNPRGGRSPEASVRREGAVALEVLGDRAAAILAPVDSSARHS